MNAESDKANANNGKKTRKKSKKKRIANITNKYSIKIKTDKKKRKRKCFAKNRQVMNIDNPNVEGDG